MDKEYTLEIYKNHSEYSKDITSTRNTTNSIFITIHTVFMGFCVEKNMIVAFFGILLCILWRQKIHNLSILNEVKIKLLIELEEKMQSDFYKKEWEELEKKKYKTLTSINNNIINVFIGFYIFYILHKFITYLFM